MNELLLAIATMCQINAYSVGYYEPLHVQILQRRCVAQALRCIDNKQDKKEIAACIDPDRAFRKE